MAEPLEPEAPSENTGRAHPPARADRSPLPSLAWIRIALIIVGLILLLWSCAGLLHPPPDYTRQVVLPATVQILAPTGTRVPP